jgi:hypothetical protein
LSGALSRDRALEQQWLGNGSRDYKGLNMHKFPNTCPNGTCEVSIGIHGIHVDDDRMVGWENPRLHMEVMGV